MTAPAPVRPQPPVAVLWDMDGTLIDTEPHWSVAEHELVASFGGTWTVEDGMALVGNPMAVTTAALQARGVDLSAAEIAERLQDHVRAAVAREVPWQPGAHALLAAVVAAGIPCALVTSSAGVLAHPFAREAGMFDAVVCSDDVAHPKPHPMPYLLAADRLGVDVTRCLVVEDSPAGLTAGLSAGARVLAVQAFTPIVDKARTLGVPCVLSLDGLSVDDLGAVARGETIAADVTRGDVTPGIAAHG